MGFLIRVWCDDCSGDNDEQGCFGGGSELKGKPGVTVLDEDVLFDTREEAEEFGWDFTRGPPWSFEVVEVAGT